MAAIATPPASYWKRLHRMLDPGGWLYEDAHYLVADMDVDASAARRWVPWPLTLAKPATASIFTAYFPHNSFGSVYCEAGLFLHVEHFGTRAIFSPWMLVDDDVALITGRELLGYPKKLGTIRWSIEGERISGVAERRGAELVRMEGKIGERVADPPPILGRPHRNVRSAIGLAAPKLLAFTPYEEPIEVRRVDIDVKIGTSERDPLGELGFGRVRSAYLHRVNIGARPPNGIPRFPVPLHGVSPVWYLRQLLLRVH
jgi:acetoacetate decarboxylase